MITGPNLPVRTELGQGGRQSAVGELVDHLQVREVEAGLALQPDDRLGDERLVVLGEGPQRSEGVRVEAGDEGGDGGPGLCPNGK